MFTGGITEAKAPITNEVITCFAEDELDEAYLDELCRAMRRAEAQGDSFVFRYAARASSVL